MIPEIVPALLAIAKIGGIILPLFSGYGISAVSTRLVDADARALFTADGVFRRGKPLDMKSAADQALDLSPTVEHVIVVNRIGLDLGLVPGRDHWWHELVDTQPTATQTEVTAAEDTLMVIYYWMSDMGWMMGPWLVFGALILGSTFFIYDGAPDFPAPDRLWEMVEKHKITTLGISPILVRALIPKGDEHWQKHDLSSLRFFASTGEP